jgi:hypothetical protein
MPYPWDIPAFPEHGDPDSGSTYKMVGYALTQWEELEYQLSHLYSLLIGKPALIVAIREYGEPRIFADRLRNLKLTAAGFFVGRPNQKLEGDFEHLCEKIEKMADRRNEIAHGYVRIVGGILIPIPNYKGDHPSEYGLVPPLYAHRKLDDKHRPKYIYTANELMQFGLAFFDLSAEALHLKLAIAHTLQP